MAQEPLAAQTLNYGTLKGVIVAPQAPCVDAASLPLVLLVSGAGGFDTKTKKRHGEHEAGSLDLPFNCPKPCWYAYMQVEGKHKTAVPPALIQFIKDLHALCSHNKNSIVAWGFSRGGRWLEEIVLESSVYLDVAIIIAGYPQTKGGEQNASVAKELIAVNSTIVCMVHFAADACCNASKYPRWYAEFELAMAEPEGGTGFMSYMVPGTHDDGHELWCNWNFAKVSSELVDWFEMMWPQLDRNRLQ